MTIEQLYSVFLSHPIISTDTRNIAEGSIFFALKGPNFNANTFAQEALNKGASFAIVDEAIFAQSGQTILVDDVLTTLQQLATHHRAVLNIPVIAIVGSNGKTTTKELMTSVLKQQFNVLATPGNFNNHIGLPLTLLKLDQKHQVAVIEMGANHIGENALLCEIAKPDMGLITNNGRDHLEGFGSIEGVAQSNSELYYYLLQNNGTAFVNANDKWLVRMSNRLTQKVTYAANAEEKQAVADCMGIASSLRPEIQFTYVYKQNGYNTSVLSCLSGDYNFDNIMAAVVIGKHLNMQDELIKKGIEEYIPQNNRSQVIKKEQNTIYLDAYNANPSSLEAALRNYAAMDIPHKIAIIGDMFEMGSYAREEHKNMILFCKELGLEKVWLVGEEFSKHRAEGMLQFVTTDDAIVYLKQHSLSGKNIFIKGSRGMKLESLGEFIV